MSKHLRLIKKEEGFEQPKALQKSPFSVNFKKMAVMTTEEWLSRLPSKATIQKHDGYTLFCKETNEFFFFADPSEHFKLEPK